MQGMLRCARYALAPNRLKYCGPDKNFELTAYVVEGVEDVGLGELLNEFAVMYPYLRLIAEENGIKDGFDERVVEAYWIGNELLERVSMKEFYDHLLEKQKLKKRFKMKDLKWMMGKVPAGARVHHSFHVFNIWRRTGHEAKPHTLETMDNCRISWGEVMKKGKSKLEVKTQELRYEKGKLRLKDGVKKEVSWRVGDKGFVRGLKKGDWITMHWGWVCEKVSKKQVRNLEKYTKWHLKLANTTL